MNLKDEQVSDPLIDKIRQTFPGENPADVLKILELYGADGGERETPRVRLAVLKLCGGDLGELLEMINAAKGDYRDVLAWAESPNQLRISPAELVVMPPEASNEVREKDCRQYLAWLRGEE